MLEEYRPAKCEKCGESFLTLAKDKDIRCPICKSSEHVMVVDKKGYK